MLEYLNYGTRGYARIHRRAWRRDLWEFQAVTSGELGLVLGSDSPIRYFKRTLFVFPPDHLHGWANRKHRPCEIMVMHFDRVPSAIEELFRRNAFLALPLTKAEIEQLEALRKLIEPRYRNPDSHSSLLFDKALIELSLIALEKAAPPRPLQGSKNRDATRVEEAIHWLRDHLHENPSIPELARAIGVSQTHLRRLFSEIKGKSPQRCLQDLRVSFAQDLLANTDDSIGEIADAVGATSITVFTRAFRKATGRSPTGWRRHARNPREISRLSDSE